MAAATSERTIRIKFDGTVAGLTSAAAKARAELKALDKQTETNRKNLDGFSKKTLSLASSFGQVAVKLASLSSGVGIIVALGGVLAAASGAAFLLPAALGVAAAALITTKLGADGIKAAFSQLNPALDTLKAKVSATFEKGLAPAVTNLKTIVPQLIPGFTGIAAAMSLVAVHITTLLKAPSQVSSLNTILGGTATVVRNVGAFLAPVIAGFLTLAAQAIPAVMNLTSGLGGVGDKFKAWTDQVAAGGFVSDWIASAVDLFRSLWSVIKDVAAIVADVFGAAQESGAGLTGTLGTLIGTVRSFLDSAQGHDTLVAVFQALNTISGVVSTVLTAALQAIAPALPPLLSAFSQLAVQVSTVLVPAIQFLAPLLLGLATFLQQNLFWLGPIIIAVGAWAAAQWLLNAAMDANPIGLVIIAIATLIAIVGLIINNLDFFRGIWDAVWKFCSDIITTVVNWFRDRWNDVWGWFTGLLGTLGGFFSGIWNGARNIIGGVIDWFRGAWDGAVSAVRGFFSGLASFAGGIWDGIVSGVKNAINSVIRVINGAINGVNNVTGIVGIPAIPHIPMLAKGGTATGGRSYLVGERGPELFTPGRTGRVTNADTTAEALGGGGGTQTIALTLDLGAGIQQRMAIEIDRQNRATVRTLGASR